MKLLSLTSAVLIALASVSANPIPESAEDYVVSNAEFDHWLATTDANLTFIGDTPNPLTPRAILATRVTYCNTRIHNVCGGACTVYNGGAICLSAPGTNCLAATNNVGFCSSSRCVGTCNQLSSCGVKLDAGFCYTPGTNSILVGPY